MSNIIILYTVFCFILIQYTTASSLFYEDGTSDMIITPRLRPALDDFDLYASVTFDSTFKEAKCNEEPQVSDAFGKVVLIQGHVDCMRFYKSVIPLQEQGAVGVLFARSRGDAGESGFYYYWTRCQKGDCDGIKIPLAEIDRQSASDLYQKLSDGQHITIRLTNDHNEYGEPVESGAYYAFTAISISFSLGLICLASYKLYLFVHEKGWSITLNSMVFMLQITTALLRIVWIIDPWGFYFVYPMPFTLTTSTLHLVPFTASSLLLTCYWQESIRSFHVMDKVPRLRKFKWPLIAFVIVLLTADITSGALRAVGKNKVFNLSLYLVSFFYAAVCISTTSFFLITAFLLLRKLKAAASLQKLSGHISRNTLHKLTGLIIICAVGNAILLAGSISFVIIVQKAWWMFAFWFSQYFILEVIGLAQLLIFQTSTDTNKSTTTSQTTDLNRLRRTLSNAAEVPTMEVRATACNEVELPVVVVIEEMQTPCD